MAKKEAEIQEPFGEALLVDSKTGKILAEGRVLEGKPWKSGEKFLKSLGRQMGYKIKDVS